MTNRGDMTSSRLLDGIRRRSIHAVIGALLLAGAGCSDGNNEEQAQRHAPPPPPPPQTPQTVSLASIKMHPKVQFPEERAPSTQEAAQAVADFASALASGSEDSMNRLLADRDRRLLQALVSAGEWRRQTESIELVRVCSLTEDGGAVRVALGVQDASGAFLSAWEANEARGI